ncbi:tetratricopeptide repeat protein [Lysobacter sp. CA199]|uniref:tetratricopeptide repeat protein n=1 Tax=Lysobacter sp. CA199 TaxID=3455608 RepID=UPI003F8D13A8
MSDNEIHRFGGFRLEADQRRLWHGSESVDLPPKVFDTLLLLVRQAGSLVTREEFFARLWPNTVVTEASLGRHIWQVRKALEREAGVEYVQTVPKQGYRFIGEVVREAVATSTATTVSPGAMSQDAIAAPTPAFEPIRAPADLADLTDLPPAVPPVPATAHPAWRRAWPALAAGGLIAIAAGVAALWPRPAPHAAEAATAAVPADPATLAVAVFDFSAADSGTGSGDAWLADALPELLGRELALNERLRILNGQRLAELAPLTRGQAPDRATLLRLSRQLGLRWAVLGRYRLAPARTPDALSLELDVLDATNGQSLQRLRIDGDRRRPGALIAAAGAQLRERLQLPRLSSAIERTRGATTSDDVALLRDYADGVQALRRGDAGGAQRKLDAAVKRAPDFLPAQLALTRTLMQQGYHPRAGAVARAALGHASAAPREIRLALEALMYEADRAWPPTIDTYRALYRFYPEDIEYGLGLARAQSQGGDLKEAQASLDELRKRHGSADPRIDLTETAIAEARGDYAAERDAGERALRSARSLRAPYLIGSALLERGWGRNALGDQPGAIADYRAARAQFEQIGDAIGQARSDVNLGGWHYERGDFAQAGELYQRALTLFESAGMKASQAAALQNLANIDWAQNRRGAARQKTETLLQLSRELGDPDRESWTLSALAALQFDQGETVAAMASYRQALAIAERSGLDARRAWALRGLGDVMRLRGDYPQARELLDQALAIERRNRDYEGQAEAQYRIGQLLHDQGRLEEARKQLDAARDRQSEHQQSYWGSVTGLELASLDIDQGQARAALGQLDKIEPALRESQAEIELALAGGLRAEALVALGQLAAARAALEPALTYLRNHGDSADALNMQLSQARVLAAEGKRDEAGALLDRLQRLAQQRELGGVATQVAQRRREWLGAATVSQTRR